MIFLWVHIPRFIPARDPGYWTLGLGVGVDVLSQMLYGFSYKLDTDKLFCKSMRCDIPFALEQILV